jgi:uracil-DNA glycosylase
LKNIKILNEMICNCTKCPRLVEYRENVKFKKSSFENSGWRKPVPGYGDINAEIFVIGLAPSANGGNMTGRIFTGDASGDFLMNALYLEKMSNQPISISINDGLKLHNVYMSAAVKCVPPKNLPNKKEQDNCFSYLKDEFSILKNIKCVLVLGRLAHMAYLKFLKISGVEIKNINFVHGKHYFLKNLPTLFCSYHPSPQNTNTKKLSESSLRLILRRIKKFTYKKHLTS